MLARVPDQWRILHGLTYWKGLLEPLEIKIRRSIIHYGELAEATYDAFITEPASRFAGNSRYAERDFLAKCGVAGASMYEVTKFVYATSSTLLPESLLIKSLSRESWSKESNWIGYVAVATDAGKSVLGRRDVVVAWRGTKRMMEWMTDFQFNLQSAASLLRPILKEGEDAKVHHGWLSVYTSADAKSPFNITSARDQVLMEISRLVKLYKNEDISITMTGHSLGAAISTLSAIDVVANGINTIEADPNRHIPVTAIVFACPRVGDAGFKQVFDRTENLRLLRVRNQPDVVPDYPPISYEEVGDELSIDTRKSGYLKSPGSFLTWHNLEAYLHGVAGTQGKDSDDFSLEVDRDVALVNKRIDALKDELLVPAAWRVEKNKGMVKGGDGRWILMDREIDM
ncbi:phospholipase A1-IIgamma-like [Nymphaea colorata]|nr:phospholipase A1-IIgamma-like [Nymphaea colorata]